MGITKTSPSAREASVLLSNAVLYSAAVRVSNEGIPPNARKSIAVLYTNESGKQRILIGNRISKTVTV